jgi:uncharacterized membrane protein YcjF (UPF0283 family)
MADPAPQTLAPLSEGHLVIRETRDLNVTVANVTDMTERAAKAMVDVAEATHVRPKQVVMRYSVGGTAVLAVSVCVVLWMTHAWALPWQVALGAVVVVGVPFGLVASKVLPKLLEHTASGSVS